MMSFLLTMFALNKRKKAVKRKNEGRGNTYTCLKPF